MVGTALCGVIVGDRQELWLRGVLNGDRLGARCHVAARIRCCEGSGHNVTVRAAVRGVRLNCNVHHPAVVHR